VDLQKLQIDRSIPPRRRRRAGGRMGWWVLLGLAGLCVWLFRVPLMHSVDRLRLPEVAVARAVRSNPLASSAVPGTAANGYIVAKNRAALSADTPGRIVEMNVEEGSVVRKGDVVARLYADEYRAALKAADAEWAASRVTVTRAEADLEAARSDLGSLKANIAGAEARVLDADARLRLAEQDLTRARELERESYQTKQALDQAESELERANASTEAERAAERAARSALEVGRSRLTAAEAAVNEALARVAVGEANRDLAQATLDKTEVRAPFDGVVVLKDAEVGEVVSPNSQGGSSRGSVVTMVDFDSLEVQVDMPETSLHAVAVGGAANIYLDAFPEIAYRGRVERIWPTANRQKATVEVRATFLAPDDKLRPEMGVRVVFTPRGAKQAGDGPVDPAQPQGDLVLIPSSCVVRIETRPGVFELERDVARWREIELGDERGERVIVTRGLNGGERLVAAPPSNLNDGDRVLPKEGP
jgi:RND family efflux transporter MFP subunit